MGIPLSEDVTVLSVDPETPAQHVNEGVTAPSGAALTFHFDIEGGGIPREAQRLVSTDVDYGIDHLQASGTTTNMGKWWIDTARSKMYDLFRKMLRVYFLLDPDHGAWAPGIDTPGAGGFPNFVSKFTFPASGSGTTITLNNYTTADARGMEVLGVFVPFDPETGEPSVQHTSFRGINSGNDYAMCDPNGSDMTKIDDCTIGDASATITTATPLFPASWSGTVTIVKPTTFHPFPTMREDRTLLVEQQETGWVAVGSFASDYQFSAKRVAYPLKWQFYENGNTLFAGTFRVVGSETDAGAGSGLVDLTDDVIGVTPGSGYEYSLFPSLSTTGNLKYKNTGGGYESTLNLSGVAVPGAINFIKVYYAEEIANPAAPDANTQSPTNTSCMNSIKFPENSALNRYGGSNAINNVIDGGQYCSKFEELNAGEVAAYKVYCNNTTCRFFEVWNPYIPLPEDVNLFFGGRGIYFETLVVGQPDKQFGRDNYDGLLTYIGFPVYKNTGLQLINKQWFNHGRFRHNSGEVGDDGYKIFRTWQEAVDDDGETSDAVGLFGDFVPHTSKKDSAGGIN